MGKDGGGGAGGPSFDEVVRYVTPPAERQEPKRCWKVTLQNFDPKTKLIEATETWRTVPMTKDELDQFIGRKIKDRRDICYTVGRSNVKRSR